MIRHGTLCYIAGLGVFIIGKSGSGKSQLALSLLDRGHQLVADDAVIFTRHEKSIMGSAPTQTQGCLHVFGMGLIDVTQVFGKQAAMDHCELNIIIQLIDNIGYAENGNLLKPIFQQQIILEQTFNKILFPINDYQNPALILETLLVTNTHQDVSTKTLML